MNRKTSRKKFDEALGKLYNAYQHLLLNDFPKWQDEGDNLAAALLSNARERFLIARYCPTRNYLSAKI